MPTIIRSIHESTGVSSDAQGAVARDLLFHHPFLNAPVRGLSSHTWKAVSK